MLDRDEDMTMTGTRHPFLFKYRVACTNEGKIIGCRATIYQNAGYSIDLSLSVSSNNFFIWFLFGLTLSPGFMSHKSYN